MDTATLIKLIVGLAVCAVPFGYGIHMILESRRAERELREIMEADFPGLLE